MGKKIKNSTNKKNLAKNFTSEKYYFIKDNINVTSLINGQTLAKKQNDIFFRNEALAPKQESECRVTGQESN